MPDVIKNWCDAQVDIVRFLEETCNRQQLFYQNTLSTISGQISKLMYSDVERDPKPVVYFGNQEAALNFCHWSFVYMIDGSKLPNRL